jgi:hypothetical protein
LADKLVVGSISTSNPAAVTAEASYLTTQQPGLFQPNPDGGFGTSSIVVWQKKVSGSQASFEGLSQNIWNPEFWFLTK